MPGGGAAIWGRALSLQQGWPRAAGGRRCKRRDEAVRCGLLWPPWPQRPGPEANPCARPHSSLKSVAQIQTPHDTVGSTNPSGQIAVYLSWSTTITITAATRPSAAAVTSIRWKAPFPQFHFPLHQTTGGCIRHIWDYFFIVLRTEYEFAQLLQINPAKAQVCMAFHLIFLCLFFCIFCILFADRRGLAWASACSFARASCRAGCSDQRQ